jgi:hypothetical protein
MTIPASVVPVSWPTVDPLETKESSMQSSGNGSQPTRPPDERVDVDRIFREGVELDRAMRRAFQDVCIENKRLGLPLIVWEDGRTIEIPPEEIEIPSEDYVENGPG